MEYEKAQRTDRYRWSAIKYRCFNPAAPNYSIYGGRGIRMCARWRSSFDAFYSDVGHPPKGRSLDRVDNDGHYSCGKCDECAANGWPMNVRWATRKEQSSNLRKSVLITHDGLTLCVAEWARRAPVALGHSTLWRRLFVSKWDMARALSTPVNQPNEVISRRDRVTINVDGITHYAKDYARMTGKPYITIYRHAKQQSK